MNDQAGLRTLALLKAVGGPKPVPVMTDGLGPKIVAEILAAFPGREPTLPELETFVRALRARHRR